MAPGPAGSGSPGAPALRRRRTGVRGHSVVQMQSLGVRGVQMQSTGVGGVQMQSTPGFPLPRPHPPPLALVPALLLVVALLASPGPALGLDPTVPGGTGAEKLLQVETDPLGDKDPFLRLSEAERRSWPREGSQSLGSKARLLQQLEVTVPVAVRLVGFDGHGKGEVDIKPEELLKTLGRLKLGQHVPVIHSPHGSQRQLSMLHSVSFSVQRTPQRLGHEISTALTKFFQTRAGDPVGRNASLVPHSVVDSIIEESVRAHDEAAGGEGYSLYLLNLRAQPSPYAYSYHGAASAMAAREGHGFWCPGTSFQAKRYLWVDLNAGPVQYGPQEGEGDGQGGAFTPGVRAQVADHNFLKFNPSERPVPLMSHLASLVGSAVEHLFAPPLLHHPIPLARATRVLLLHMLGPGAAQGTQLSGEETLKAIQEEFLSHGPSVLLPNQELLFTPTRQDMSSCQSCTLALHASIRTASRLEEGVGPVQFRFLDSLELHHLLKQEFHNILGLMFPGQGRQEHQDPQGSKGARTTAAVHADVAQGAADERLIPVFLFDLPWDEPLLLDGMHQALAFDDMVLVIRTQSPPLPSAYLCNGDPVRISPQAVHRPLISALLQTIWGVAPVQTSWSPALGAPSPSPSWRWTMGQCPFGPFSSSTAVSPLLRDTAMRNVLLSLFNDTVSASLMLLHELQAEFVSESAALGPLPGTSSTARAGPKSELRERWEQRWGVLLYKLEKSAQGLSQLDFVTASFFLLSSRHDVTALYNIATLSASHMETVLDCYQDAPLSASTLLLTVVSPFACIFVLLSMRKLFQRKEKMF